MSIDRISGLHSTADHETQSQDIAREMITQVMSSISTQFTVEQKQKQTENLDKIFGMAVDSTNSKQGEVIAQIEINSQMQQLPEEGIAHLADDFFKDLEPQNVSTPRSLIQRTSTHI